MLQNSWCIDSPDCLRDNLKPIKIVPDADLSHHKNDAKVSLHYPLYLFYSQSPIRKAVFLNSIF